MLCAALQETDYPFSLGLCSLDADVCSCVCTCKPTTLNIVTGHVFFV